MYSPGYYEFFCPVKTVAGRQALEEIPQLLKSLRAQRPLLITDQGVYKAGLLEIVKTILTPHLHIAAIADDVPPDSELQVVTRLAALYRQSRADAIIAVGGGSVLDTAKGVNIMVSENADDLMRFAGAGVLKRPLRPLLAVPTTAGTGSEVTLVAVIANQSQHRKLFFTSQHLVPDAAILDVRMTLTLPPAITAATAMDALSHAMEAYTCLAKNPLSDSHALLAVELITQNVLKVLNQPDDTEGRLALAVGAHLAGVAFSNSMVGMVHTLGHSVGAVCGIPHGTCMSILLPYGLEYNMHKNGHLTAELLLPTAGARIYAQTPAHRRARQVVASVRELNRNLRKATAGRHACSLKDIRGADDSAGVPLEKLPDIAAAALGDASIFYNPEELDYDDMRLVLSHAWEGIPISPELLGDKTPDHNRQYIRTS